MILLDPVRLGKNKEILKKLRITTFHAIHFFSLRLAETAKRLSMTPGKMYSQGLVGPRSKQTRMIEEGLHSCLR